MKICFDTNVVLSALLFSHGKLHWLRSAWRRQQLVPLVCKESVSEVMRVLAYPKFQLTRQEQEDLLADFLPYCETFTLLPDQKSPLLCRDSHDQMFLDLALQAKARYLVTGDQDLLVLRTMAKDNFQICTPEELQQWVHTP